MFLGLDKWERLWDHAGAVFVRTKTYKNKDGSRRTYLHIVENVREGGKVRQRILANLGRLEKLQQGQIDQLIEGLARWSHKQWVQLQANSLDPRWARDLGPALIFRRLWEQLGLPGILRDLLSERRYEMDVEEAIFCMVLHRLSDPGSKLSLMRWKEKVFRPQFQQLQLQHLYRSLDFLSECKDEIEGRLFEGVRDLFNLELDLVFWDTTSCYFEGQGAEGLCEYGYSRDRRPDRVQVVIGLLMSREGVPVAHEVFPGNTADPETFRSVLGDLRGRFRIRRVICVCDRGMVSEGILREMESLGLEYICGVRMRRIKALREVLGRPGRYHQVGEDLRVKEVVHQGVRYIVCFNPEEAERERFQREQMVEKLRQKLSQGGLKALIGNRGYRRYLRLEGTEAILDQDRLREEARYDGKYVLRTNTGLSPEEVALAYKGLWQVERAFRELKSGLELRPVYHWTSKRIRGHIMVCFLAFLLEVASDRKLKELGSPSSLREVMADLEALRAVEIRVGGSRYVLRTELQGRAYDAFRAVGMRPPGKVLEVQDGDVVERGDGVPLTP